MKQEEKDTRGRNKKRKAQEDKTKEKYKGKRGAKKKR